MVCGWCIINDCEIYLNMEGRVATSQDGIEPISQDTWSKHCWHSGDFRRISKYPLNSKGVLLTVHKCTWLSTGMILKNWYAIKGWKNTECYCDNVNF